MNLEKDYYTTREAGRLLNVLPHSIATEIREGKLKAERFDGTGPYVILRDDLAEYIERRRAKHGRK